MHVTTNYLALDVGSRRIGVAIADSATKIPRPLPTVMMDASPLESIVMLAKSEQCSVIVIGFPRNQSGETTAQTTYVQQFADKLKRDFDGEIVYQDESLTSVIAEQRLAARQKHYDKSSIDGEAACIILTDYLEQNYG
ncbi:MAG: Holliday junction resolvase RuvX [Candidatus Saccharimonadales bacterium]